LSAGSIGTLREQHFVSSSSSSFLVFIPSYAFNSSFKNKIGAANIIYFCFLAAFKFHPSS
jgi:hypothetical protein